ncbi:helix-turn-helix domain-containing protein [Halorubrum xinjiangense]|uniref:helix-turn-helix domain-containing protein n=1 Tax=Halorubrum xinjiangense TaxID=261291 RepID=UPI00122D503B
MGSNRSSESELSDTQQALLQSAVQNCYFEIPRGISTTELAEANGLSSREASEEMTRALGIVLRDAGFDG